MTNPDVFKWPKTTGNDILCDLGSFNGAFYFFVPDTVTIPARQRKASGYAEVIDPVELALIRKQSPVWKDIDTQRESKIQAMRWRMDRHNDEVALGVTPTEDIVPILTYVQALRDLPVTITDLNNVVWPSVP